MTNTKNQWTFEEGLIALQRSVREDALREVLAIEGEGTATIFGEEFVSKDAICALINKPQEPRTWAQRN